MSTTVTVTQATPAVAAPEAATVGGSENQQPSSSLLALSSTPLRNNIARVWNSGKSVYDAVRNSVTSRSELARQGIERLEGIAKKGQPLAERLIASVGEPVVANIDQRVTNVAHTVNNVATTIGSIKTKAANVVSQKYSDVQEKAQAYLPHVVVPQHWIEKVNQLVTFKTTAKGMKDSLVNEATVMLPAFASLAARAFTKATKDLGDKTQLTYDEFVHKFVEVCDVAVKNGKNSIERISQSPMVHAAYEHLISHPIASLDLDSPRPSQQLSMDLDESSRDIEADVDESVSSPRSPIHDLESLTFSLYCHLNRFVKKEFKQASSGLLPSLEKISGLPTAVVSKIKEEASTLTQFLRSFEPAVYIHELAAANYLRLRKVAVAVADPAVTKAEMLPPSLDEFLDAMKSALSQAYVIVQEQGPASAALTGKDKLFAALEGPLRHFYESMSERVHQLEEDGRRRSEAAKNALMELTLRPSVTLEYLRHISESVPEQVSALAASPIASIRSKMQVLLRQYHALLRSASTFIDSHLPEEAEGPDGDASVAKKTKTVEKVEEAEPSAVSIAKTLQERLSYRVRNAQLIQDLQALANESDKLRLAVVSAIARQLVVPAQLLQDYVVAPANSMKDLAVESTKSALHQLSERKDQAVLALTSQFENLVNVSRQVLDIAREHAASAANYVTELGSEDDGKESEEDNKSLARSILKEKLRPLFRKLKQGVQRAVNESFHLYALSAEYRTAALSYFSSAITRGEGLLRDSKAQIIDQAESYVEKIYELVNKLAHMFGFKAQRLAANAPATVHPQQSGAADDAAHGPAAAAESAPAQPIREGTVTSKSKTSHNQPTAHQNDGPVAATAAPSQPAAIAQPTQAEETGDVNDERSGERGSLSGEASDSEPNRKAHGKQHGKRNRQKH